MNRRKAIGRILLTGTGAAALLAGNEWYDTGKRPELSYLDRHETLLAALAETIIPATDTPGARDAGVQHFIIKMVKEATEKKSQNKFINGLRDLKLYCLQKYGKPYQDCAVAEQEAVLGHFERKGRPLGGIAGKIQTRILGQPFFTTLKTYTITGYCTSREGATQGLAYLPVPGRYDACTPLKPGQKAWATN
ncbi:MAG TPA: gluconate 2-dehydrogenase subunit 3 family protein [Flavisolibacter sp.]|nr:gluconate 2-dehydrogenase subunit 3 family protein [Flavisolibacter sp.]